MTRETKAFASKWISFLLVAFLCVALLPNGVAEAAESVIAEAQIDYGIMHGIMAADGAVYTWGRNTWGQLGTGKLSDVSKELQLISYQKFQDRIVQAKAGNMHSVALSTGGKVFAWGSNSVGQIAVQRESVSVPTEIGADIFSVDAAVKIDASYNNTAILTTGNKVYVCGDNTYGQLGTGAAANNSAQLTELTGYAGVAKDIAVGNGFVAVVTDTGEVFVAGDNAYQQFGNGSAELSSAQMQKVNLPAGAVARKVVCGNKHLAAQMADGSVYGWGFALYAQLGTTNMYESQPVKLPTEHVNDIVAYGYGIVLLDDSNAISIYGLNRTGQWGNGTMVDGPDPNGTKIETLNASGIAQIGAGMENIAVRTQDGKLFAWGDNSYYQSGIAQVTSAGNILSPQVMSVPPNDIPLGDGDALEIRVNDQPVSNELTINAGELYTIDIYLSGIQKADAFVLPLKFNPADMVLTDSSGEVLPGGTISECSDATGFTSYNNSLTLQNGYPFVNNEAGLIKLMGRNTTGEAGITAPTKICSMTFKGLGKGKASIEPASKSTGGVYDYLFPEGPCFGFGDNANPMLVHWNFNQISAQEITYRYIEMADFSFQVTQGAETTDNVTEFKVDYADKEPFTIKAVPDPANASAPGFLWKTPTTNTGKAWSDYIEIDQSDAQAVVRVKQGMSTPVTIVFPVSGQEGTIQKSLTLKITKPLPDSVAIGTPEGFPEILTDLKTSYTLTSTVLPDKTEINKNVLWKVSDDKKLSITPSKDGSSCVIKPLASTGEGTVKVTAYSQDDDTVLDELDLKIQIAIETFAIQGAEPVMIQVGVEQTLSTQVTPGVAYIDGTVQWSTRLVEDKKYIDINKSTGVVTAKPGAEGKDIAVRAVIVKDEGEPTQTVTQGAMKLLRIVPAGTNLFQADIQIFNKKASADLITVTLKDDSVKVGDSVCVYPNETEVQPAFIIPVTGQVTEAELGETLLDKTGGMLFVSVRGEGTETDRMLIDYGPEKGMIYGTVARWGRSAGANAGVTVTLNGIRSTITDENGYFCFEDCDPGEYTITLTSPNYYTRANIQCTLREDESIEVSSANRKLDIYPGDVDGTTGVTTADTNYYLTHYMGTTANSSIYQGDDGKALFDSVNFFDDNSQLESININDLYLVLRCEGAKYSEWLIQ